MAESNGNVREQLDADQSPLASEGTIAYSATDAASSGETPGTFIADKYKLLQQIGEGGMGSVWMAEQFEPVKRRVAVKLIRTDRGTSKTILARFDAERQAIALMDHPHIAKLLDAGETPPTHVGGSAQPYFVMELVKGVPLTEFCDAHKLSIPDRLSLFMQICSAVQHAHQKGIIHRDLKPSNILVELQDDKPVPKVIDFGLAKATSGMQLTENTLFTGFGTIAGTPTYMAPEQATLNAVDIDTRADVYSLGVILYELLTGTTPITRETIRLKALDEMMKLIREQEAPTPSSRLSSSEMKPTVAANRQTEPLKLGRYIKGELDWIVMKALSKERDRRYETANGFAKDIERFLNHEAVLAGPVSAGYRLRKLIKRNKGKVIAASLVFFALLAGFAGATWGWLEANHARAQETERAEGERLAKLDTEAKRQEAEKNLAFARKGNEILGSVFDGLDPKGNYTTVAALRNALRDSLKNAVRELDGTTLGDPLDVATLQQTLGVSLLNLGERNQATELFAKVLETRKHLLGANHPDTLGAMNNLASGYSLAGKLDKALPILEETYQLMIAKLGSQHPDTLTAMTNLAWTYRQLGKMDQALPLLEQTVKLKIATLGADHSETLLSRNNLAKGYQAVGNMEKALPIFEETLQLKTAKLGAHHPSTLSSKGNLAWAYRSLGKLDKALPLLEETLKDKIAALGAEHPDTLATQGNLAMAYQDVGKLDQALPIFEKTLQLMSVKLGTDHPDTLTAMGNLGLCYMALEKMDKAVPILEKTLQACQGKLGADHPDTISSKGNLALAYQEMSKLDQALPLLEESLRWRTAKLGVNHPDTIRSLNNLAQCYLLNGKSDKALPMLEETLRLQTAKWGPDHPETLIAMNNLAMGYERIKQWNQALPLFERAAVGFEKRGYQHKNAKHVIPNVIDAYETARQFDQAERWRRKWLPVVKAESGATSPDYARDLAGLGIVLLKQQKWTDAEPLFRESLTIRAKALPDAWITFSTQSLLGEALMGQKKYTEAEPLLIKGYQGLKACLSTPGADAARLAMQTRLAEALDRLIQLYTETNKPDDVKKWQAEKAKLSKPTEKK